MITWDWDQNLQTHFLWDRITDVWIMNKALRLSTDKFWGLQDHLGSGLVYRAKNLATFFYNKFWDHLGLGSKTQMYFLIEISVGPCFLLHTYIPWDHRCFLREPCLQGLALAYSSQLVKPLGVWHLVHSISLVLCFLCPIFPILPV